MTVFIGLHEFAEHARAYASWRMKALAAAIHPEIFWPGATVIAVRCIDFQAEPSKLSERGRNRRTSRKISREQAANTVRYVVAALIARRRSADLPTSTRSGDGPQMGVPRRQNRIGQGPEEALVRELKEELGN